MTGRDEGIGKDGADVGMGGKKKNKTDAESG
jgi:hypothetical protein